MISSALSYAALRTSEASDELGNALLQEHDPAQAIPPLYGALVKNEQDVHLLQRLAFMSRRKG